MHNCYWIYSLYGISRPICQKIYLYFFMVESDWDLGCNRIKYCQRDCIQEGFNGLVDEIERPYRVTNIYIGSNIRN